MNSRERVLALLDGRPVDCFPCLPITMMFAADLIGCRYLDYATDYHVLAEGQLRVTETFDFDYVNTMSDPAVEASDCGAAIKYYPSQPPAIDEANALLKDKTTLAKLKVPGPAASRRMFNRIQAVALLKERVGGDKMVEGWIEGPCAEGADLRGINNLMVDFFDDPGFIRDLFDFVVQMELEFAKAQVAAGAEVIGIGDAAASLVGPTFYNEFVWPYEKKMVDGIHAMGARTRLHICGNTRPILEGMGRLGCSFVELDSLAPMSEGREKMGPGQVLLGNIDPVRILRDGTPAVIYEAAGECHRQAGKRFMVGAGCEVPRDTAPANLKALVRYAREHSPA
ncbi:MAG TPA: uroporphyrinogen decarboxylase family protein [Terriglobia bacterium]|nr:uroporphyrinogen decarboxylase family protein [Terriglobia bacterium]